MINKYSLLYIGFIVLLSGIIYGTSSLRDKNIEFQKEILIKQAQTHFKDQINTRKWNAQFGGLYVKPINGLKPNPYLQNSTIKTENGVTLIQMNPAWMTRQLSELSDIDGFSFRIVSSDPLNPINSADEFEKRALEYINTNKKREYYELEGSKFRYLGALVTTKECIGCHSAQGYKIGDIRGGISIILNSKNYNNVVEYIEDKVLKLRLLITFLLLSILLLVHKQFKNNENLNHEVINATKEILSTKRLLQEVLDTDHSFLMVSNDEEIILANQTMLDFFETDSLDEFKKLHQHISDAFIKVEDENFLCTYIGETHWIEYLIQEQAKKDLKIMMRKNAQDRYFRPHVKQVIIEKQNLHIIIFDDITEELERINLLQDKASRDSLTKLFNKGKFNNVLEKEIDLAQTTSAPLSIIFLDIDHFKVVNDTHGHNIGDSILKEIAEILLSTIRQGDFVARWGGEEFVITLQSTNLLQASKLAQKIRVNIENYNFIGADKQTISLGVTQYITNETLENFTKRVDEALYEAKNSGRNRVVTK